MSITRDAASDTRSLLEYHCELDGRRGPTGCSREHQKLCDDLQWFPLERSLPAVFAPMTAARQVDVPTAHFLFSMFMMRIALAKGRIPNNRQMPK